MKLLRSLYKLHKDPKNLDEIFEIMRILNRNSHKKNYYKLLKTDDGGKVAYFRDELEPKLMDKAWLASLPEHSLGSVYLKWIQQEKISAEQLANASLRRVEDFKKPHPYFWTARKIRDCHDIWHVLCGYGTNKIGESCLVAFTYTQTGGKGWLLVALNALFTVLKKGKGKKKWLALAAILEGFKRGRKAIYLLSVDYDTLFHMNINEARKILNISDPKYYNKLYSIQVVS
jgi:ubiquinone biosynthesis protein COQ4